MVKKNIKSLTATFLFVLPCLTFAQDYPDWSEFIISHAVLKETKGVIYFKHDLEKNVNRMCEDLRVSPERLTMIDQESASIYRINEEDALPPSYNTSLSIEDFYDKTKKAANALKKYCVKINLAPVADLQKGSRVYSTNFEKNKQYVHAFAKAMRDGGVTPTYKHFPGMNRTKSVYETPYAHYYKNIYGEGVVDSTSWNTLKKEVEIFNNNKGYDLLMFSIATYPEINERPVVFDDKVWDLAYRTQPNSIYIPDDLSELRLKEQDVVDLFERFDLLMFTDPRDVLFAYKTLNRAWDERKISEEKLNQKREKMKVWLKNQLYIAKD